MRELDQTALVSEPITTSIINNEDTTVAEQKIVVLDYYNQHGAKMNASRPLTLKGIHSKRLKSNTTKLFSYSIFHSWIRFCFSTKILLLISEHLGKKVALYEPRYSPYRKPWTICLRKPVFALISSVCLLMYTATFILGAFGVVIYCKNRKQRSTDTPVFLEMLKQYYRRPKDW